MSRKSKPRLTNCTYCNREFTTEWFNVCENCMNNIVDKCRNSKRKRKGFYSYRKQVRKLTEKVAHLIPDIEKRNFNTHHIDHKYSIYQGYLDGKTPEEIADINNLRIIKAKENLAKGIKCE